MLKNERVKTTCSLYFNYFIHGIGIVILAQNMTFLGKQWGVGNDGVSYIISSLGIGRLLVLYVSGDLSDKLGRKLFINIGIITYFLFFTGIIVSRSIYTAYFFGILAGMANSFLDSGTYPALMELYPENKASFSILIKAFASIGELILPIFVALLEKFSFWYGWSFIFCALTLLINFIFMRNRQFPDIETEEQVEKSKIKYVDSKKDKHKINSPTKIILGVILTVFGYISMATFYIISQWLTQYGISVVDLNIVHARMLVSIYSIGSILGVILTAVLVNRWIKPIWFMFFDTVVSFLTLLIMSMFPNHIVMICGSFIIGCSAASGVMQIGLTIMGDIFPNFRGRVTGIYYTASALASFSIPVITGMLAKTSIHYIMWFDTLLSLGGIVCSVLVILISNSHNVDVKSDVINKTSV